MMLNVGTTGEADNTDNNYMQFIKHTKFDGSRLALVRFLNFW